VGRLPLLVLLGACGSQSDAGEFEDAVSAASAGFEECQTGQHQHVEDFPYTREAALTACQACAFDVAANAAHCTGELDRACGQVLSFDRCDCEWRTSFVDEETCRSCLQVSCGVSTVDDASAPCALDACFYDRDACGFTPICAVR